MRADLKWIIPNDHWDWWNGRPSADAPNRVEGFGWFQVGVGDTDSEGDEDFSVLVATPASVSVAQGDRKFHGIIVPVFEPRAIEQAMCEFVASITGSSWESIREQLKSRMRFDGLGG
jgi:hypothetical protein